MKPSYSHFRRAQRRGRAFAMIEVAIAQVIVAVAITAMCHLLATGTAANSAAAEMTIALNLADNIHELARGLPFSDTGQPVVGPWHDVWDLDGQSFSPPIDVGRTPIDADVGWEQRVSLQTVDPKRISSTFPNNPTIPTARLTVSIYHRGRYIYGANWLVVAADQP